MSLALVVPCVSMPSIEVLANTKTVEAFKATEYDGFAQKNKNRRSDAKVFADGLKKYDSAYSKVYEEGSKVTNSDFWNKSRRIKYWASHGTDRGRLYGNGNLVRTAKSGKSCESEIKDSEVKFVYNEETGYYEPNYEFTLSDESVVDVNCCNGDVNIVEESVK
ncbi:MAG: hypothetical protein UH963_13400 [Agathobacter sp.]|nr:hypothetical protein [Agathobacter sp.]